MDPPKNRIPPPSLRIRLGGWSDDPIRTAKREHPN
ncbi:uncharacterized protein G2W53_034843 [Senna tora]|uniref:Uncharacterized protein n=1 Tax=Senna tora TaxID=362788 RepID=A0A834T2I4_9FABA|nr:uncharacterized protein G2W53_034843 [Senna tora]